MSEAATIRRKRTGYKTESDYLQSLARYDCACNVAHRHSALWDKLSAHERDAMDAALLAGVKENKRPMTSRTKERCWEVMCAAVAGLEKTLPLAEFLRLVEASEKSDALEGE